jgi:mannitol-specific phosphotransferase system IIBC component
MKEALLKNWKTTLAGVAMAVVAYLAATNVIDTAQSTLATAILSALGLSVAKDSGNDPNGGAAPTV